MIKMTLTFKIKADTSEADGKIKELKRDLQDVRDETERTERAVEEAKRHAYDVIRSVASISRTMIGTLGDMMSPIETAIIRAVVSSVEAVVAVATMWESNPYTAAFGVAIQAIAISTSIVTAIQVEQGFQQAARNTQRAANIINSVLSNIGGLI